MSASALASAYRATTHFTPRNGVAEPGIATITRPLIGYSSLKPRGFPGTDDGALGAMAPFEYPSALSVRSGHLDGRA